MEFSLILENIKAGVFNREGGSSKGEKGEKNTVRKWLKSFYFIFL